MEIYFIRHGESANNRLYNETGDWRGRTSDPDLTDLGVQQSVRLAAWLARPGTPRQHSEDYQNVSGFGLTHLYTSLMVRAVKTALPLADALGLPPTGLTDLHELHGIFEFTQDGDAWQRIGLPGSTPQQLQALFPTLRLPADLPDDGWWQSKVEGRQAMLERAQRVLAFLRQQHSGSDDRVALISHGGFYHAFLHVLLRLPPPSDGRGFDLSFGLNNTGITRIILADDAVRMVYANNVAHLMDGLISS